jgi:ABC-type Fe3+ transport system substrate-binding protein
MNSLLIGIGPGFLIAGLVILANCGANSKAHAAAPSPAVAKAQKDAETKGYLFVASHDELVSRAKKEGKLRVIISMADGPLKHVTEGFKKKYPFLDTRSQGTRGTEVYLRLLHELKAGLAKGIDVHDLQYDHYEEYLPYLKKFDIIGMAEQQVLQIPIQMVDPINRNIVAVGSGIQVVAFNRTLIPAEKVPNTWEEFLNADFKDRKFIVDIRPKDVVALVPAWGLEKTLDFARKLAAQKPVWGRGNTRMITTVLAGEHALFFGPNFDVVLRAKSKDVADALGYKIIQPVPIRLTETYSVLSTAESPYAGLLWLEFLASPEGQKILDQHGPYEASVFIPGTVQEKAARGKILSVVDWNHYSKTQEYEDKIIEAYGFPKAR